MHIALKRRKRIKGFDKVAKRLTITLDLKKLYQKFEKLFDKIYKCQ